MNASEVDGTDFGKCFRLSMVLLVGCGYTLAVIFRLGFPLIFAESCADFR